MDYDTPSESTKQNEVIIMFSVIFFLLWLTIPLCESVLKTLKDLNDVHHYETKPTIHDELHEMEERLNDIIHLNRHRYTDFQEMNKMHQNELNIIYKRVSSLEEKFLVLSEQVFDIHSIMDKIRPEVATCKGGYEVVS
jgi:hypothetical protein